MDGENEGKYNTKSISVKVLISNSESFADNELGNTATDSSGVSHDSASRRHEEQHGLYVTIRPMNINISGNKKNINKIEEIFAKQKDIAMPIHFSPDQNFMCTSFRNGKDTADSADISILFGSTKFCSKSNFYKMFQKHGASTSVNSNNKSEKKNCFCTKASASNEIYYQKQ